MTIILTEEQQKKLMEVGELAVDNICKCIKAKYLRDLKQNLAADDNISTFEEYVECIAGYDDVCMWLECTDKDFVDLPTIPTKP